MNTILVLYDTPSIEKSLHGMIIVHETLLHLVINNQCKDKSRRNHKDRDLHWYLP